MEAVYDIRDRNCKRIVIWGNGKYGKKILFPLMADLGKEVIAYIERDEKLQGTEYIGIPILAPESIAALKFDLVLITVNHPLASEQIRKDLETMGVPKEKVYDAITDCAFFDLFLDQKLRWIRDFSMWLKRNNISGDIAECGVYRGETAKFLNKFFPGKRLYLFDTFEGFIDEDLEAERKLENETFNNSAFANAPVFDETSIDYVMKKMVYPDTVIIRKGYFPDSAEGVHGKFCFVNLDMDLFLPMLNGLRFFWEKIEPGGGIMLHDYFHHELPGVKKAVDEFEKESGLNIIKAPVGDGCSIVLFK